MFINFKKKKLKNLNCVCFKGERSGVAIAPGSTILGAVHFNRQCVDKCIWIPDNLSKIIRRDFGMFSVKIIMSYYINLLFIIPVADTIRCRVKNTLGLILKILLHKIHVIGVAIVFLFVCL